jgi:maleate isomerase
MKLPFDTDDGIGTRANLGLILLSTDETLEAEMRMFAPQNGVALYHTRIPMVPEIRPETLAQMQADIPAAAALLPSALEFDVIGYGCTSASSVIGSQKVAEAVQQIFPKAKITDPLAALIAAGQALGVRRPGFLTPYLPEVSARMRDRLEEAGFDITGFGSFEEGDDRIVARITEASITAAALHLAQTTDCDALVVSCTNLRCAKVIASIEAQTGLPVLSSNQALAWHMMRLAGLDDQPSGFGALFSHSLAC